MTPTIVDSSRYLLVKVIIYSDESLPKGNLRGTSLESMKCGSLWFSMRVNSHIIYCDNVGVLRAIQSSESPLNESDC